MTPLKQCDPRWGSKKLGNSTICNIGCTVTSIAMLSGTTPDKIVDQADFTSYGAILWQSLSKANIKFHWRGYTYENDKVAEAITNYGGCLVEVSMPQAYGGKHWVLFIGNKQMADPITGKLEATSKYTPTGYCVLEPLQTTNDNMIELSNEKFEELVTKATAYDEITTMGYDIDKIKVLIKNNNQLNQQLEEIRFDLKNETQSHKACELELSELKEKYNQALDDSE